MSLNAEQLHILEQLRLGFEQGMQCYFIMSVDNKGTVNVHGDGPLVKIVGLLDTACSALPELIWAFQTVGARYSQAPPPPEFLTPNSR